MQAAIRTFENPEFGCIRTCEIDGNPWFVGKDVAKALGYGDISHAVRVHVDEEDKGGVEMSTPGGRQKIRVINESGLYSLILSSKLPSARRFKRWVTSEVLPAIRMTGAYHAPTPGIQPNGVNIEILKTLSQTPMEQMPAVLDYLIQAGCPVHSFGELYGGLLLPGCGEHRAVGPNDSSVQEFADEIIPQCRWDLLPFGFLYDLYKSWAIQNQVTNSPLGRNKFITGLTALADAGRIPGWYCPGRKTPVRPKNLMDQPEPLLAAYMIDPRHLIRKATYTGLLRLKASGASAPQAAKAGSPCGASAP